MHGQQNIKICRVNVVQGNDSLPVLFVLCMSNYCLLDGPTLRTYLQSQAILDHLTAVSSLLTVVAATEMSEYSVTVEVRAQGWCDL